jgi:hypothetical protein
VLIVALLPDTHFVEGRAPTGPGAAAPSIAPEEIQATYDALSRAMRSRDIAKVRSLYDPARGAYTACAIESARLIFEVDSASPSSIVIRTEPYLGYVRAYARSGSVVTRSYLRRAGSGWVFTEPLATELGIERRVERDDVRVSYWSVDEEIAPAVLGVASYARRWVEPFSPAWNSRTLDVYLFPTREGGSSIPCVGVAAAHVSREPIEIWAMASTLTYSDPLARVASASAGVTFVHEALHVTQALVTPLAMTRPAWWLIEGWPTLLANGESRLASELPRIGCSELPTYAQLASGVGLVRDPRPDTVQRFYTYAASAVKYVGEINADGYWRFMRSYEGPGTPDEIVERAVGLSADGFRDAWAAWVKKRYCP